MTGGQQWHGGIKIFARVFPTGLVRFWPQTPVQYATSTGASSHSSFLKKDATGRTDLLITTYTFSFLGICFPTHRLVHRRCDTCNTSSVPLQCMGRIPLSQFPHYPAHTGMPGPWDHHCSLDSLQGESSPPNSVHSAKQVCQFFWSAALPELPLCWKPSMSHTDPEETRSQVTNPDGWGHRYKQAKHKSHKTNFSSTLEACTSEGTTVFWVLRSSVLNV